MTSAAPRSRIQMGGSPKFSAMIRNDIQQQVPARSRLRDRIIDWLGAQGALLLSIYMCSAVALIAFLIDIMG